MAEVKVDANDLKVFARAMRTASRRTGTKFRTALKEGAGVIAIEARARADEDSKSIPPTIKPFAYGASAGVQAGNASVPLAVLFEQGNAGGSERDMLRSQTAGKFKHPTFGHDPYVSQDMHRYLGPAAVEKQEQALEKLLQGVNEAFAEVGLDWG